MPARRAYTPFVIRRGLRPASIVLAFSVLFAPLMTGSAAAADVRIVMPYRQIEPCIVSDGLVFASDVDGTPSYDLYRARWGETPELLSGGAGDQRQPASSGDLLAYVSQTSATLDGVAATSVARVRSLSTGQEIQVSVAGTYAAFPAIRGMDVVWVEVRASGGWGAILHYDLDVDDDGTADFLEVSPPVPAGPQEAVSGTTAGQVALGAAGMVWAEKSASGDYAVLLRQHPLDAVSLTLADDAGRSNPEPFTAGTLVVWAEADTIVAYDTLTTASQDVGVAGVNNTSPVTDGTDIAWVVGSASSDWSVKLRTSAGTQTVVTGAFGVSGPAVLGDRIAWSRTLDDEGVDSDIEWRDYSELPPVDPEPLLPVYRFYRPSLGTHFYTASETEKANVQANLSHIYTYEGPAYELKPSNNTTPLYRFYKASTGTHFYTASETEKANVQANLSHIYTYEGPAYYVSGSSDGGTRPTVWRFYNKRNGTHFYTASPSEKATVESTLSHIYQLDGAAFYLGQ